MRFRANLVGVSVQGHKASMAYGRREKVELHWLIEDRKRAPNSLQRKRKSDSWRLFARLSLPNEYCMREIFCLFRYHRIPSPTSHLRQLGYPFVSQSPRDY